MTIWVIVLGFIACAGVGFMAGVVTIRKQNPLGEKPLDLQADEQRQRAERAEERCDKARKALHS